MTASAPMMDPLLAGSLSGFALADVLQLLELGGRTGVLVVNGGPLGAGSVRLRAGRVVAATCDGPEASAAANPASAVAALLEFAAGHWAFHASDGVNAADAGVGAEGLPVSALLVDAARRRDERARAPVDAAADDVPLLAADGSADVGDGSGDDCLTAADLHVLAAVDGVRDVRAIAALVRRDAARVHATVARLRRLGILCARASGACTRPVS